MLAMVLPRPGLPLEARDVLLPVPGPGEVCLRVAACGVCRTDLHVVDGELPSLGPPGGAGPRDRRATSRPSDRTSTGSGRAIGSASPGWAGPAAPAGSARSGRENLCVRAPFTGYHRDGGYAECGGGRRPVRLRRAGGVRRRRGRAAPLRRAHRLPRLAAVRGDARRLGLYGFGAAAHLVAQLARHAGQRVFAFTRPRRSRGPGLRPVARSGMGRRLRRSPVPSRSTPPSSSPRSVRWSPQRSGRWTRVARSFAPGST